MLAPQVRKPQISFQPERMETPVDLPCDGVAPFDLCEGTLYYHMRGHPRISPPFPFRSSHALRRCFLCWCFSLQ
jgi:hypothetical protein